MKTRKVIVDTGPLVAYLNKNDAFHTWVLETLAMLTPPLYTCEAVLSEACFLLRHYEDGAENILNLMERRTLLVPFNLADESSAVRELLKKYHDVPMSLADACLVRMVEQVSDSSLLTLDKDFTIYRIHQRKVIPIIMPLNK